MSRPQISTSNVRRTLSAARAKLTAPEAMRPVLNVMRGADPSKDVRAARLGLSLLWLADDVIAAVNRKLERVNISEAKLDVLMILAAQLSQPDDERSVRQTPSGLAEYFGITKASATGLIDWLENRKLVARTRHATDRRSTPVQITPAGEKLVAQAVPIFEQACGELVDVLSERDRRDLQRILDKLWIHMKARAASASGN
jgi:DNA-binding MarR family transcriptional regulator